ncbi:hypothetical protein RJ55_04459 [Drechmeria coniospora]|nr:hypothetical protein RJ55_04459 [Drechmeria coniospora]
MGHVPLRRQSLRPKDPDHDEGSESISAASAASWPLRRRGQARAWPRQRAKEPFVGKREFRRQGPIAEVVHARTHTSADRPIQSALPGTQASAGAPTEHKCRDASSTGAPYGTLTSVSAVSAPLPTDAHPRRFGSSLPLDFAEEYASTAVVATGSLLPPLSWARANSATTSITFQPALATPRGHLSFRRVMHIRGDRFRALHPSQSYKDSHRVCMIRDNVKLEEDGGWQSDHGTRFGASARKSQASNNAAQKYRLVRADPALKYGACTAPCGVYMYMYWHVLCTASTCKLYRTVVVVLHRMNTVLRTLYRMNTVLRLPIFTTTHHHRASPPRITTAHHHHASPPRTSSHPNSKPPACMAQLSPRLDRKHP